LLAAEWNRDTGTQRSRRGRERADRHRGKSNQIDRVYQLLADKRLSPREARVAIVLLLKAGKDLARPVYEGNEAIGVQAGLCARSTRRIMQALKSKGYIAIDLLCPGSSAPGVPRLDHGGAVRRVLPAWFIDTTTGRSKQTVRREVCSGQVSLDHREDVGSRKQLEKGRSKNPDPAPGSPTSYLSGAVSGPERRGGSSSPAPAVRRHPGRSEGTSPSAATGPGPDRPSDFTADDDGYEQAERLAIQAEAGKSNVVPLWRTKAIRVMADRLGAEHYQERAKILAFAPRQRKKERDKRRAVREARKKEAAALAWERTRDKRERILRERGLPLPAEPFGRIDSTSPTARKTGTSCPLPAPVRGTGRGERPRPSERLVGFA
jgi:hypothetical protein